MRNIRQNLVFAFFDNAVGIPMAAGVLYPFFGILLSPMIAAGAMAMSSLSVVTNANRLRVYKPPTLAKPSAIAAGKPRVELNEHKMGKEEEMARVKDPVCGIEIDRLPPVLKNIKERHTIFAQQTAAISLKQSQKNTPISRLGLWRKSEINGTTKRAGGKRG
jgi:hypothetical protein